MKGATTNEEANVISPLKRKPRHPPFVMAFKAVLRTRKLSAGAKLMLLIIKSYADSSGLHCYPGEDRLAEDYGCSIRTAQRLIAELRAAGFMSSAQRINSDGTKSSTAYLLDDERHARIAKPRFKKRLQPDDTSGGRSTTPVAGGEGQKVVPFTEEKRAAG